MQLPSIHLPAITFGQPVAPAPARAIAARGLPGRRRRLRLSHRVACAGRCRSYAPRCWRHWSSDWPIRTWPVTRSGAAWCLRVDVSDSLSPQQQAWERSWVAQAIDALPTARRRPSSSSPQGPQLSTVDGDTASSLPTAATDIGAASVWPGRWRSRRDRERRRGPAQRRLGYHGQRRAAGAPQGVHVSYVSPPATPDEPGAVLSAIDRAAQHPRRRHAGRDRRHAGGGANDRPPAADARQHHRRRPGRSANGGCQRAVVRAPRRAHRLPPAHRRADGGRSPESARRGHGGWRHRPRARAGEPGGRGRCARLGPERRRPPGGSSAGQLGSADHRTAGGVRRAGTGRYAGDLADARPATHAAVVRAGSRVAV